MPRAPRSMGPKPDPNGPTFAYFNISSVRCQLNCIGDFFVNVHQAQITFDQVAWLVTLVSNLVGYLVLYYCGKVIPG